MSGYAPETCLVCGIPRAHWYILRDGDVVVTWACDQHLTMVLEDGMRGRPASQRFIVQVSHAAADSAE